MAGGAPAKELMVLPSHVDDGYTRSYGFIQGLLHPLVRIATIVAVVMATVVVVGKAVWA